jgi:hypothetical protein
MIHSRLEESYFTLKLPVGIMGEGKSQWVISKLVSVSVFTAQNVHSGVNTNFEITQC